MDHVSSDCCSGTPHLGAHGSRRHMAVWLRWRRRSPLKLGWGETWSIKHIYGVGGVGGVGVYFRYEVILPQSTQINCSASYIHTYMCVPVSDIVC